MRPWGGWSLGGWLMGGAGLWVCREPFYVGSTENRALAESIDNQNPQVIIEFLYC